MHAERRNYLVAAVSGRALATSAARGGHTVVVLDCFADRDTRDLATACRSVVASHGLRLDRRRLLEAASELNPAHHSAGLVCGSGFEGRTALLGALAAGRTLLGNTPPVVASVKHPRRLFPLLDRLQLRYPAVRFDAPDDPAGWLVKRAGGAGGAQVRWADAQPLGRGEYLQRFESGRTLSALFLADGRRALVLGFNEQWTTAARPATPFLFGGAVNQVALPPAVAAEIEERLKALVGATGLVGLNGLDFLLRESDWLALEINPRPTATVELYDPDCATGLFEAHLHACAGHLPERPAAPLAARALANVIAAAPGVIREDFHFPSWCRDLPMPGTAFAAGDPVCTVHAEAGDANGARLLVQQRQRQLESALVERTTFASPA